MEKIRILFYSDAFVTDAPNPDLNDWGVSELKKFIEYKTRGLAEFEFDLVLRHSPFKLLDPTFLCKYDEVWLFGVMSYDGPPNELYDTEVQAVNAWMDQGGGLFITGDHSAPNTGCREDHSQFLTYGRSLGRKIKRAKELRVWQGPPTVCTNDNANTHEGNVPDLDHPLLDKDEIAQTLMDFPCPPHRLFWWKVGTDGKVIPVEKFPDHGHEGELACPDLKGADWPYGSPEPVVAALGRDKRENPRKKVFPVVLAFDGDPVSIGRIVADTSFHHYFNENLRKLDGRLANGYPKPNSDLDQVAQFFGNLALWLAPRRIRDRIKWDVLRRVADHPDVFESQGSGVEYLGKVVRMARDLEIDFQNLYRAFAPSEFEAPQGILDELLNFLILGEHGADKLSVRDQELIYGTILTIYHQLTWGTLPFGALEERLPALQLAISQGIREVSEQAPEIGEKFAFAQVALHELASSVEAGGERQRTAGRILKGEFENMSNNREDEIRESLTGVSAVTDSICKAIWLTRVNDDPPELVDVKVDSNGKITGNYFSLDASGNPVIGDPISGHCTEGTEAPPIHLIHYERTDSTGTIHTYDGRIFLVNLGLPGTVRITLIIGTHKPSMKFAAGDDDWMGGHTT